MGTIVISEFMDRAAVDWLRVRHQVRYDPALVDRPADLRAAAADADALIVRNRTQVRGALLAALSRVRVVGRLGVGMDNIDLAACRARGIEVLPASGANTVAVAEYVLAVLLVLVRGPILQAGPAVLAGDWPRAALGDGGELYGRTLGLLGFGAIARAVAGRARAFAMTVIAHDPLLADDDPAWARAAVTPVDFDALLADADALSIHVPLSPATRNRFDARTLAQMKPGAILVNTARGSIVDEAALADALHRGHLGGAAIDVFAAEPPGAANPLAHAPHLIATPHIAGVTAPANRRVSFMIAEQVAARLTVA